VLIVSVSGIVFAGGSIDVSTISQQDVGRLEKIVEALEPVYAIQTVLDSFGNQTYPMIDYMKTQKMKINLIFNEYGLVHNEFHTYEVPNNPKLNILLARLKSRYSYLSGIDVNKADELKTILAMLKE
jgi:hypothetical protein